MLKIKRLVENQLATFKDYDYIGSNYVLDKRLEITAVCNSQLVTVSIERKDSTYLVTIWAVDAVKRFKVPNGKENKMCEFEQQDPELVAHFVQQALVKNTMTKIYDLRNSLCELVYKKINAAHIGAGVWLDHQEFDFQFWYKNKMIWVAGICKEKRLVISLTAADTDDHHNQISDRYRLGTKEFDLQDLESASNYIVSFTD